MQAGDLRHTYFHFQPRIPFATSAEASQFPLSLRRTPEEPCVSNFVSIEAKRLAYPLLYQYASAWMPICQYCIVCQSHYLQESMHLIRTSLNQSPLLRPRCWYTIKFRTWPRSPHFTSSHRSAVGGHTESARGASSQNMSTEKHDVVILGHFSEMTVR